MTELEYNDRRMIVGSVYFPVLSGKYDRARQQQMKADLLTAVTLDHPDKHGSNCPICLMIEFDEPNIAAHLVTDLGFCTTLLEILGSAADLTAASLERFAEIWGSEYPPNTPRKEG